LSAHPKLSAESQGEELMIDRCQTMHLVGFAGGFVAGMAGAVGLVDKLIELAIYPNDASAQLVGLIVVGVIAGIAAGIGLAASTGCYSDGY
jgi:hypothetical protein